MDTADDGVEHTAERGLLSSCCACCAGDHNKRHTCGKQRRPRPEQPAPGLSAPCVAVQPRRATASRAERQRLLDKGVPVNVRDRFGNTILTVSCQNGLKRMAKAALRRGADINAPNYKGNTPLHFCYTYGYGDTLGEYLISKGADDSIRNNSGYSCYEGTDGNGRK